jgi:hypothetical protein
MIEQLLKDVYKFYKTSSKRQKGLNNTTLHKKSDSEVNALVSTMHDEVRKAKDDMKRRPSLRLKSWNATRWLSRSACLMAICKAYEHILEHLRTFATRSDESANNKKIALDLYERLTSYDTLVFIFLYNELAWTMARYSQLLQAKDIQIRGVGRNILSLCRRLESNYPPDSSLPVAMLGTGMLDDVMEELLGNDLDCMYYKRFG